ncbi:MAG: phosphate transport system regulatory protein PhoU [Chloroflexi bacterium]|nr:MAG: phosphate transport system regulatory protein PhoU [Chloroflexota bacterium]
MTRAAFQERLDEVLGNLLAMGNLVDTAIERSVRSLAERDAELAQQVIAEDRLVNQAMYDLEEQTLVLIATQQPLASDLRTLMSAASIATELERMGDYAEGIATITLRGIDQPLLKPLIDVPRMTEIGRELLRGQLQAFIDRDVERARMLAARDDEIDRLFDQVYRELLTFMAEDPRTITRATHLIWVAHNLERIGDRTTNIGERVVFLVTGEVVELNP